MEVMRTDHFVKIDILLVLGDLRAEDNRLPIWNSCSDYAELLREGEGERWMMMMIMMMMN